MVKQMTRLAKFVVLMTALIILPYQTKGRGHEPEPNTSWARTVAHGPERRTDLQFYLHGVGSGESPTVVTVVQSSVANQSFGFGYIAMFDDPLRVGPNPNSTLVGRAQGLEGAASREDSSLIMVMTCTFSEGIYNGSSISILGRNSVQNPVREIPVVGGTGVFRMARGYVFIQTYFSDVTNAILTLGFNATVFH